MFVNENADLYRHLTFASVGGFFGAYAILCRSGILASAQTMNLLELTLNALRGDAVAVLLHLGALALYPIFFAMSVQWSTFSGAKGFVSSTIFSTNNTKQASLAFAQYITDGDRVHFKKVKFYLFTLLAFHVGAAVGFFAVKLMGVQGAWVNIILAAAAYSMVVCEDRYLSLCEDEDKEEEVA